MQPFSLKSCCTLFDGFGALLPPRNMLQIHRQLVHGYNDRHAKVIVMTQQLAEQIKKPQLTVLSDRRCVQPLQHC